jgi:ribosomal protein S8
MSMTDPIADMLTRIRNAVAANHRTLTMPGSKVKLKIAEILKAEGFINEVGWKAEGPQGAIDIQLRWNAGQSAIEGLERVSRPEVQKRPGHLHRLHQPRHDDRPRGPQGRRGRRARVQRLVRRGSRCHASAMHPSLSPRA